MKKFFLLILLIANATGTALAQNGPRLIVRGDDMVYSHSGNEAIAISYRELKNK